MGENLGQCLASQMSTVVLLEPLPHCDVLADPLLHSAASLPPRLGCGGAHGAPELDPLIHFAKAVFHAADAGEETAKDGGSAVEKFELEKNKIRYVFDSLSQTLPFLYWPTIPGARINLKN